jgi:hypothetical protein
MGCSGPTSFSASDDFSVATNTIYYITLFASGTSDQGIFSASVDPSVTFQSGFNASGDSLIFSSDIAAPPVPLPATVWLLLSGLGGLGVLARKRKAA